MFELFLAYYWCDTKLKLAVGSQSLCHRLTTDKLCTMLDILAAPLADFL
jgi:hypothetical protein